MILDYEDYDYEIEDDEVADFLKYFLGDEYDPEEYEYYTDKYITEIKENFESDARDSRMDIYDYYGVSRNDF